MNQSAAPVAILLIERECSKRKLLRGCFDGDGLAVLAVNTIGEALARLRSRHYSLVLCSIPPQTRSPLHDYDLLVDADGLLHRSAGYDLYLPGIGIKARAVLMFPSDEPWRVRRVVGDLLAWLDRTAPAPFATRGAGGGEHT
ncbi:MAG: hypothetical protein WD825_01480 [Gemmatimonadaceae bacterium]